MTLKHGSISQNFNYIYFNSLRLSKDEERKRQEKLARERIEAARQRRRQGRQLEDEEIIAPDTEDPASLQEAIARHLDKKHHREMEYFMRVCVFGSFLVSLYLKLGG